MSDLVYNYNANICIGAVILDDEPLFEPLRDKVVEWDNGEEPPFMFCDHKSLSARGDVSDYMTYDPEYRSVVVFCPLGCYIGLDEMADRMEFGEKVCRGALKVCGVADEDMPEFALLTMDEAL